jgi:hypothetical protein
MPDLLKQQICLTSFQEEGNHFQNKIQADNVYITFINFSCILWIDKMFYLLKDTRMKMELTSSDDKAMTQ